jgi:anti-sigma-K factor RskA
MPLNCDEVRELAAAYVLGALERDEEAAVREHLVSCPDAHAEVMELGSVVPALAEAVERVEPSSTLKARILAAAAAEPPMVGAREQPVAGQEPLAGFPDAQPLRPRRSWFVASRASWALRAAAVVLIGLLGGWNLLLQNQLGGLRDYQSAVASVIEAGRAPGSRTALLAGSAPGGPSGLAAVRADGSLVLAMRGLMPTSGSEVYEAWLVAPNAQPIPVGSFGVGADGTGTLTGPGPSDAPDGTVVAVTREPVANPTAPTLPILSSGTAVGSG